MKYSTTTAPRDESSRWRQLTYVHRWEIDANYKKNTWDFEESDMIQRTVKEKWITKDTCNINK